MDRTANSTIELDCPQCGAPVVMPTYTDMAVCEFCGSTLVRQRVAGSTASAAAEPSAGAAASTESPAGAAVSTVLPAAGDEEVLHSVRCSQCAGSLSAREGRRVLVCKSCGVRVLVRQHGGVSRWYFPARVDRLKAARAAAAWLGEHPGIAREARRAQLVDADLFYAPIWEHKALLAGWEFGRRARTVMEFVSDANSDETGRLEMRMAEQVIREPRLQERRFYLAGTDFEALGATRPRVSGRELLLPLLAGELDPAATVLTAQGTGQQVAEKGRRAALLPLAGASRPDVHLFTFRESTALLYYPIWVVRFRARQGPCHVVINGRYGSVNSAVAPADNTKRIAVLAAQAVLMAAVAAILVWFAVIRETGRASLVAAAVIVSVIAILTVWRFRTVGEVEYREPFSS